VVETVGHVGEPLLRVLRVPIGTIKGRLGTCLILLSSRLCLQCLLELLGHTLDATPVSATVWSAASSGA
jgi:hypothetical protein